MRRISSTGTVEPPEMKTLSEERSWPSRGTFMIAARLVGTAPPTVDLVALDDAPEVAHHVGIARAERRRQHDRPAVGDRRQAADDRAADMELRQRVDHHRARPEVEDQRVGPGGQRQRAVGVARELRQAGRAAGVEQRRHACRARAAWARAAGRRAARSSAGSKSITPGRRRALPPTRKTLRPGMPRGSPRPWARCRRTATGRRRSAPWRRPPS